ncbi:hypothetical protein GCM10025864_20980 [Luteimicrobium album]|uniref:Uncharacterized protein n=1 Tax=Luteimicrobium album TaxID=1054550 RepID=A0ABQ6I0T1_9MICO|nr:hypothetical protein GCM10025864_20980 [Luteimicrobium album]
MPGEQAEERLAAQQRRVRVGGQHDVGAGRERGARGERGRAGARRARLLDVREVRSEELADPRVAGCDDDHGAVTVDDLVQRLERALDDGRVAEGLGEDVVGGGVVPGCEQDGGAPGELLAGGCGLGAGHDLVLRSAGAPVAPATRVPF